MLKPFVPNPHPPSLRDIIVSKFIEKQECGATLSSWSADANMSASDGIYEKIEKKSVWDIHLKLVNNMMSKIQQKHTQQSGAVALGNTSGAVALGNMVEESTVCTKSAENQTQAKEENCVSYVEDKSGDDSEEEDWETLFDDGKITAVPDKEYDSDDEDANVVEAKKRQAKYDATIGARKKEQERRNAIYDFNNHRLNKQLIALGYNFDSWTKKCEIAGSEEKALEEILAESSRKLIHKRTQAGKTWATAEGMITWEKRVQVLEADENHEQHGPAREFNAILLSYEEKIAEYLAEKRKIAENKERFERLFSKEVIKTNQKAFRDLFKVDGKFEMRQFMKHVIERLNVDNVYYCVLIMLDKWQVKRMLRNGKAVVDTFGFTAKGGRLESRNCETTYQRELAGSVKKEFLAFNKAFSHGELKDTKEILEKFIVEYLDEINGKNGRKRSFESRSARDMVSNRFMKLLKEKSAGIRLHRHLFVLFQEMTIVYAKEIDDMKRDELLQSQKTGKITGAAERMAIKNGGVKTLEDLRNLLAAEAANKDMEVDSRVSIAQAEAQAIDFNDLPWNTKLNEQNWDVSDIEYCSSDDEEPYAQGTTHQEKEDYEYALRCQEVENPEEDFIFEDRKMTPEEQQAEEARVTASQEKEAKKQRKREEKAARQAANRVTNVAAEVVNAQLNELPSAPAPLTEEEVAVCLEARKECKFFKKNGFCCRGAECLFSHDGRKSTDDDKILALEKRNECKFFKKNGWCQHGKDCHNKHGERLPQEGDEIQPRQECNFFKRNGWCGHGKECKHLHGGREPHEGDEIQPRQECNFFKRNGWCKHGSNCKHLHGGRDPRPEDGTNNQKKQKRNRRK